MAHGHDNHDSHSDHDHTHHALEYKRKFFISLIFCFTCLSFIFASISPNIIKS